MIGGGQQLYRAVSEGLGLIRQASREPLAGSAHARLQAWLQSVIP